LEILTLTPKIVFCSFPSFENVPVAAITFVPLIRLAEEPAGPTGP